MSNRNYKVVAFQVEGKHYGLRINQLVSIERMHPIAKTIANTQDILGVIELRGDQVPIVDLHQILWHRDVHMADSNQIIVVNKDDLNIGIRADAVTDIVELPRHSIRKRPESCTKENSEAHYFIDSMASFKDQMCTERMLQIVNVNKLIQAIADAAADSEHSYF